MAQTTFVERTLTQINQTLEQSLFAERISRQKGLLQRFDPRARLAGMLFLLIAVGSTHTLWVPAAFMAGVLLAAAASRIPLWQFVKRVCLLVLLFTALIALPALFMTLGTPLLQMGPVIITRTGANSAAFLLLRVTTSISLAALVVLTTPWNDILKALGLLHLPDVIVLILAMTYRYIHLLLHEANDMFTARKSRLLKQLPHDQERELLGATGGVLLSKSLNLSSEVYLAMQSRGYHHYPRTLDEFHLRWWDTALIVLSFILMLIVIIYL